MKKILQILKNNRHIALVGGLALFFIIFLLVRSGNSEITKETNGAKKVRTVVLSEQEVVMSRLTTSGTIVPQEYSIIRSLTPGTVQFLVPVGKEVVRGQSLFSLSDSNIENNYFNSLTSFNQTESLTEQRVLQAELALLSAEARLVVAEKDYDSTILQTRENFSREESTTINAHNTAYATLKQILTFLSRNDISSSGAEYFFKGFPNNNFIFKSEVRAQFQTALALYNTLTAEALSDILGDQMNNMLTALEQGKRVLDSTSQILQSTITSDDITFYITQTAQYQTLINSSVTSVIVAQNLLSSVKIQNDLLLTKSENARTLAELEVNNSEIGLDNAERSAVLESTASQSQLDNASYGFSNLNLPSPFTGTIISHFVTLGEQVGVGQQLVEIGNLKLVEIIADIDVDFSNAIKLDDIVIINDVYEGFISEIEPAGDILSGKVRVTIKRDNKDAALTAGGVADVTFTLLFSDEKRLVIPIKSATIEETQTFVFVVENSIAVKKVITLGAIFGDKVSVLTGIAEGDILIIPEGVFIFEGDRIDMGDVDEVVMSEESVNLEENDDTIESE